MTEEQRTAELYRAAYKCEELKSRGCKRECTTCPLYVVAYTPDVREAGLIQTSAAMDYADVRLKQEQQKWTRIVWGTIIFFVGAFLLWRNWHSKQPPQQVLPQETYKTLMEYRDMATQLVCDINQDGKIDCIDYSIVFFCITKNNTRLIVNNNPQTGLNHMFVQVTLDGLKYCIEPQKTNKGLYMHEVWGKQYDAAWNEDQTARYYKYIHYTLLLRKTVTSVFDPEGSVDWSAMFEEAYTSTGLGR
jgi:hypothetical protein